MPALIALCLATPLFAQVQPQPVGTDPRIQIVDYDPDQVIPIQAAAGYLVTLQFGSDERIENVAVGDSAAWQVTANHRGDLLFVKPVRDGVTTNLTVATDVRIYTFELSPSYNGPSGTAYMVRFRHPTVADEASAEMVPIDELEGHYRLSGSRGLRPSRIADDGVRTYIEWPAESSLPAVYAINAEGDEAIVNGYMRDGLFVIDSVQPRLVFRIDRSVARAVRQADSN